MIRHLSTRHQVLRLLRKQPASLRVSSSIYQSSRDMSTSFQGISDDHSRMFSNPLPIGFPLANTTPVDVSLPAYDVELDGDIFVSPMREDAVVVGNVPNYVLQFDTNAHLSTHWPMPADPAAETDDSSDNSTTNGHPAASISYEDLQNAEPTYKCRFKSAPGSFSRMKPLIARYNIDPTMHESLDGLRDVFSQVDIERYFFCLGMINNPEVPSAYILLHLHQFIVNECPLSSRLIQQLMKEARDMNRFSLIFHIFSMQNQGLTFGGQPAPGLLTLFLQSGHLYLDLPASLHHQPIVQEGMPAPEDLQAMLLGFCDHVSRMVRNSRLRGNESLLTSMLVALGDYQDVERAEHLFGMLRFFNSEQSVMVHNAMLRLYSRCGLYDRALSVFKQMSANGVRPDAVSTRTLLALFCANDPSAIETFLQQQRERRTLETSYMNFLLHKVCAHAPENQYALDLNHAATSWVEDQSHTPGAMTLIRYEDIPLYHSAAIKLEHQARAIYARLAAEHASVAQVPFADDTGVSFLSRVPPAVTEALPDADRWVLWAHRTSHVFLLSSNPKTVDASFHHAASVLQTPPSPAAHAAFRGTGSDESQAWSGDVFRKAYAPREVDASELDGAWIDGDTDQYVVTTATPFTIAIPNPLRATGPYLYSDVVDPAEPISEEEHRAFATCTQLTDFPRDFLAQPDTPFAVRQAYEMFEVMPDMGCPPDHITYSSMTCVMELHNLSVDVIRMYNRLRLSCLAEHPMLHFRLSAALYRTGMLNDAALSAQRIDIALSHGPSLQTIWFDAFRANDLETMMTFANKIFVSVFSPNRAPILYFPRLFFICISYLFKGLAMSSYQGKSVFILEAIRHMHNHIQFFTSDNGIEPRSKTRLLLFGIKATQTLRRPELEEYLRALIQQIDTSFVDRRKHEQQIQAHGQRHRRSNFWNVMEDSSRTVDVSAFSLTSQSSEVQDLMRQRREGGQAARTIRNMETNEAVDEDTYRSLQAEQRRALEADDDNDDDILDLLNIEPQSQGRKMIFKNKKT